MTNNFFHAALLLTVATACAEDFQVNGHKFTLPDGLTVELVAGRPLVDRPVSADFDERGRLYVTDSSGSNEPVKVQREKRPHRIRRLEDTDGDGRFDKSTVFADRLMFPEGALWFDGSLYVAAPPEIWKFTDADDDGVAEKREVWFDGKTLTHCANDLHGPYLGPDGWFYWCKGAFAEQTHDRPGKTPLVTRAAHIFRRRPEGGPIESVMAGGMDNPVEVVFTPGGERLFTTTFLVHPHQGRRDGLLHAVYGGVYGKDQRAIDNHPRTGALMPVLAHLGAAAPCGLARLESDGLGFRDDVLACCFNMQKITRHVLSPAGASFHCQTSDLLVSDNLDFHPTDVLEDADGSVLVVDTGGWFRLCCPTSQLEKADVLGGIYRIRKARTKPLVDKTARSEVSNQPGADLRGRRIPWDELGSRKLVSLLADERFVVRHRARRQIAKGDATIVDELRRVVDQSADADHRRQAIWALTWIGGSEARRTVRAALSDSDPLVRQAALHSVSLWRDKLAARTLAEIVGRQDVSPQNRRAAAEALGRVGSSEHVATLLAAVPGALYEHGERKGEVDRFLEHSLIYAAMELSKPETLRVHLDSEVVAIRRAAMVALDQLEGGDHLLADDVRPLLDCDDPLLNETSWWIAKWHPEWGETVAEALRNQLARPHHDARSARQIGERLRVFCGAALVQQAMADALNDAKTARPIRLEMLRAMADCDLKSIPAVWQASLFEQLDDSPEVALACLNVFSRLGTGKLDKRTTARLKSMAQNEQLDADLRLQSLGVLPAASRQLTPETLDFVCSHLSADTSVARRAVAVEILTSTPLDSPQLIRIAEELPNMGSMELQSLISVFAKSREVKVGEVLADRLLDAPAATSLFPDRLTNLLAGFGEAITARAKPLLDKIERENRNKLERVEQILALLPNADVRRGLRVFQSAEASCIACHRRGYRGGEIGPDLNRIGRIRDERALLESILFPSLSFVRNYEPVLVATENGRIFNGVIRDESPSVLTLQVDAQKTVRIPQEEIASRRTSEVSIMPAGLEKQLTPQQLADLVKYLKEG